jgi:hypothetical protein
MSRQPTHKDTGECEGCGVRVLWARHERTRSLAPLVPPPEGVKGNIGSEERRATWLYRIVPEAERAVIASAGGRLYVNHFMDCPKAGQFGKQRG